METEAPVVQASNPAFSRTPESLRQRQRDRLSPRGRFGKTGRITTSTREVEGPPKDDIVLSPAPPSRVARNISPDAMKKRYMQEGLQKDNSVNRRLNRETKDVKTDITPDGGSAGREGRQFTVANVGNNGRIYLR